jgi:hypothetical protein
MEVDKVSQDSVAPAKKPYQKMSSTSIPVMGSGPLSKGDWIRIIFWTLPLVFMAATMWASVGNLSKKSADQDAHLEALDQKTNELTTSEKVAAEKSSAICDKVDKLGVKVDKLDDKMDVAGTDLAAIKAKLKIEE